MSPKDKFTHVSHRWGLTKLDETEAQLHILANDVCEMGCRHEGMRSCVYRVDPIEWRGFTPDNDSAPLTEGYWRIWWTND